jgi:hypothetical protein
MNLSRVSPGDIVRVNKKGRLFLATVSSKEPQGLKVTPIRDNISYHEASAREVVEHWKRVRS